ncbi:MAG: PspC domain-containing protein [Patescibacteria group bacterium]|jgi:phage shock protein PspC (stress-responsive transcriptional regulator)
MVTQELHANIKASKKLYRSEKNIVVAGVAAGLGDYLNADPNAFRVLFAVSTLVFGLGAMVYLIMWILLPLKSQIGQDEAQTIINNFDTIKTKLSLAINKIETKGINKEKVLDRSDSLKQILSMVVMVIGILSIVFSFVFFSSILGFKAVFVFLSIAIVFAIAVVLIK